MEIADANIVLRYLLKDHEELFLQSKKIIEQNNLYLPTEVVAEIVYVLEKVYEVPRAEIGEILSALLSYRHINTNDIAVLREAFTIYHSENIDFVDAILVSHHRVNNHVIHTFDKKLKRLCSTI